MMNNEPPLSLLVAFALLAPILEAQKFPAPGDNSRVIQIHDLRGLVGESEKTSASSLATFASQFVTPDLSEGEEVKTLGKGLLVAIGRPEQQAWIERFLISQRREGSYLVEVEAKFLTFTPEVYKKLVAPYLGKEKQAVLPKGKATDAFYTGLEKLRGANLLTSPRLAVLPFSRANISVLNQVSYVKDFEVVVTDKGITADPVIGKVQDGMVFDCSCALVGQGATGISFKVDMSELERPIPTCEATVKGVKEPLTIELPQVTKVGIESKVVIPDGATALLALSKLKDRHLVVLMKTSRHKQDREK